MTSPRALGFALVASALFGCGQSDGPATVSRFDAVKAAAPANAAAQWCDAYFPKGGPRLTLPKIVAARAGEPVPSVPANRPVWVNVWATWCEPCREEMPLLVRWRDAMHRDGVDVELVFLSVDEKESELTTFLKANASFAPGSSGRLLVADDLDPWLAGFTKPTPAGIPVQVLAGADGGVRCIRGGSLHDGDYPLVSAILR